MSYFEGMKRLPGLPLGRAAYSDRMAYIGAELSRLVYEPFTPDSNLTSLLHKLGKAKTDSERKAVLATWTSHLQSNCCALEDGIRNTLLDNNFQPLNFYDVAETQALLARMDDSTGQQILVLCFRGTEMNAWDIITDLKFPLTPSGNRGRVHTGFRDAFERVRTQIERDLQQQPRLPLYTFGHSLGGALALICTKELNANGDGATYTYGAPRTGDHAYFSQIKTPIYRLEISGDPVPLVPFGYGFGGFLALLRLIPLNGTLQIARWLRRRVLGYTHTGFRVFIKYAANEPDAHSFGFSKMRVDFSANIFWRMHCIWRTWLGSLAQPSAIAGFHSIKLYSDMLLAHMLRRNLSALQAPVTTMPGPPSQLQKAPSESADMAKRKTSTKAAREPAELTD